MQLIEAIEKGRARVDYWCRGYTYDPSSNSACAIGMAWLGIHDTDLTVLTVSTNPYTWIDENIGYLHAIALQKVNDECESYEEMLSRIKDKGLADLEINP